MYNAVYQRHIIATFHLIRFSVISNTRFLPNFILKTLISPPDSVDFLPDFVAIHPGNK